MKIRVLTPKTQWAPSAHGNAAAQKSLLFLACLFVLLAGCRDDKMVSRSGNKEIALQLSGVGVKSGTLPGRDATVDPTYCFVEVRKGGQYFATGVFKTLPNSLVLSLPDNTDFTVDIKAVKKGWSYGIRRFVENGRTTINWAEAKDSLDYQYPFQNGAGAGLCWVYLTPDSSETNYQAFPQTDTYATRLQFNSGSAPDTAMVELKRQIWGIESHVHHFENGTVSVVLAEEAPANSPNGTSRVVLNYPDSSRLDIFSLGFLHQDNIVRMRVLYNDGAKTHVAYDAYISINRLEKKILDIDLGRFNASGGRTIGLRLSEETLKDGEIIVIK